MAEAKIKCLKQARTTNFNGTGNLKTHHIGYLQLIIVAQARATNSFPMLMVIAILIPNKQVAIQFQLF